MTHPLPTVAPDTERLRADAANFMQHNTDDQCRRMCRVGVDDLAVLLAWVAQFPTSASHQAAVSTDTPEGTSAFASDPNMTPPSADSGVREKVAEEVVRIANGAVAGCGLPVRITDNRAPPVLEAVDRILAILAQALAQPAQDGGAS